MENSEKLAIILFIIIVCCLMSMWVFMVINCVNKQQFCENNGGQITNNNDCLIKEQLYKIVRVEGSWRLAR